MNKKWGNEIEILKELLKKDILSSEELLKLTKLNENEYNNSIEILKTKKRIKQEWIYGENFYNSKIAYRITGEGRYFFKENDSEEENLLKVEITNPELKEMTSYLKKLTIGQKEILKLLANKNDILDQILFLKSDEVTLMKMEFEKLKTDSSNSLPWETFNSIVTLVMTLANFNK